MKLYTLPSPEFHQSFPIGRTIFALTFRMRSLVPIRGGSSQSMMSKYYSITTRLRKLLALPPLYVHANCLRTVALDGVQIFNIQSEKQQQIDDDLQSALIPPSMRTENLLFVVYRTQDFQRAIRTAATRRRQLMTVRANCLWTVNLFFVEVTHLHHQKQKKLMH